MAFIILLYADIFPIYMDFAAQILLEGFVAERPYVQ
jgi:hypothetical protein